MSTPTLTIYGADADYTSSEYPDVTDGAFSGLSGMSLYTMDVYDVGAGVELESEETVYADDRAVVTKTFNGVYKVKVKYRTYPSTSTSLANYIPELAVLKKAYNWIRANNYNIGFATANIATAVNITDWSETKFHEHTMLEFTFKTRKPL